MARTGGKGLKVFQARLGFYDTVVAAPSQAAALRAWGIHQNLFADGQATITDDARAIEAALANPRTPLVRAIGSKGPFAVEAESLPDLPDEPGSRHARPKGKAKAARARPAADRSALDAAEQALRKLDDARKREEAAFRARQETLDAEKAEAQAAFVEGRKAAAGDVAKARAAYRKVGGRD